MMILIIISNVMNFYKLINIPIHYNFLMFFISGIAGICLTFILKKISLFKNKYIIIGIFLSSSTIFSLIAGKINDSFKYSIFMAPLVGVTLGIMISNTYEKKKADNIKKFLGPLLSNFLIINVFIIGCNVNIKVLLRLKDNLLFASLIYLGFRIIGKILGGYIGCKFTKTNGNIGKYIGMISLGHAPNALFFITFISQELASVNQNPIVYMNLGLIEFLSIIVISGAITNDIIAAIIGPLAFKLCKEIV